MRDWRLWSTLDEKKVALTAASPSALHSAYIAYQLPAGWVMPKSVAKAGIASADVPAATTYPHHSLSVGVWILRVVHSVGGEATLCCRLVGDAGKMSPVSVPVAR